MTDAIICAPMRVEARAIRQGREGNGVERAIRADRDGFCALRKRGGKWFPDLLEEFGVDPKKRRGVSLSTDCFLI